MSKAEEIAKKLQRPLNGKKDTLMGPVASSPSSTEKPSTEEKDFKRLQVPISTEQRKLLATVCIDVCKGSHLNTNSLVRCLINLLKDVDLPKGAASTEEELEDILRQFLLGKGKS